MTPQEIQRTMDFILRGQADSVIRMERMEDNRMKWEAERKRWEIESKAEHAVIRKELRSLSREVRVLANSQRNYEKRLRSVEQSQIRTSKSYEGMRDIIRILTKLAGTHSKRLDYLESNSR